MTDTQSHVASALQTFSHPPLTAYRPAVIEAWAQDIAAPDLRSAMLSNARLSERLAVRVSETAPLTCVDDLADHTDFPVIAVLLTRGVDVLARALGLAWHRASLMEWVTWNQLGDHLPGVSLDEARSAISNVPQAIVDQASLPDRPVSGLAEAQLENFGLALLDVWLATLPPDLAKRVCLFAELAPGKPHKGRAALVRAIAAVKLAEGTPDEQA